MYVLSVRLLCYNFYTILTKADLSPSLHQGLIAISCTDGCRVWRYTWKQRIHIGLKD